MHIVGLDIGYSRTRRSNAIAEIREGELHLSKSTVARRNEKLIELRDVDVIAIDAPIVPIGCSPETPRLVERIFSRGPFQKRCKPGMSHVPDTGRQLREHGAESARLAATAARWTSPPPFPTVVPGVGIVEAFPNAFLGVVLGDETYYNAPKVPRGGKFDWLYDQWVEQGLFAKAVTMCGLPLDVAERLDLEGDHDLRAALVCLMTAAFALTGHAMAIGDSTGGYFFLPRQELWSPWARGALASVRL